MSVPAPTDQPCPVGPPGPEATGGLRARAGAAAQRIAAAAYFHRDFRILWIGACTSTIGTWMQKVAQSWLVLTLAGPARSAYYLGLDSFLGELPILLFTLLGGVIADRHDRRRLLMASQYGQMTCAFVLTALVYLDVVRIWHVLLLSFVAGTVQAFGGPAYQSLIPQLVSKEHLPNAIALNSIQFNIARVLGPLAAGATLAALGSAACFGINGVSFLAVIVGLTLLRAQHVPPADRRPLLDEMRSGLRFVRHDEAIRALTTLAFVSTFLGLPLLTFLPLFAQQIFHAGVTQYTWMMAASGIGAVAGALVVAWVGRFARMGVALLGMQAAFGTLIVAFALSRHLWLSYLLLFFGGGALIIVFSLLTSLVQLIAPSDMRGRVMSIYMMAFRGGSPLGSFVAGMLATWSSAPAVLVLNGVLLVSVAGYFLASGRGVREI